MKRPTGILILVVLLLIPIAWLMFWKVSEIVYYELPTYSRDVMGDTLPWTVDTFTLVDQHGKTFTRDSLNGKIYIANFFFASCPEICPQMNGNLKTATTKMKRSTDIMFISHTVDPYNDSVPVLAQYAKDYGADYKQWRFLTGKKSTIYHLAANSYMAAVDERADFIHSEKLVLIDRDFHIRGIYEGRNYMEVKEMMEDARFLLKTYKDKEKKAAEENE